MASHARGRARFHTYSFGNVLLILRQNPEATTVAGYRTWQTLGRQVRKGERGIQILAPVTTGRTRRTTVTARTATRRRTSRGS